MRTASVQSVEYVGQQLRVATSNDMAFAGAGQWLSLPVAHDAARAFHDGHECRKIMNLEAGFDNDVDLPDRNQPVIVTVPAVKGVSRCRNEALKGTQMVCGKSRGRCGGLNGVRKCCAFARVRRSTVEQGALPRCADPALSADRLVDQPQNRHPLLDQGNKRPEDRAATHETARAVNGVKHPHSRSAFARTAIFFADDPLFGPLHVEDRPDRGFGGPISQSHGRGISFHFQPEC